METFQGRVAVITGGASGIGLATAKALAREGMKLVLADIEQAALAPAVAEIEALGTEAIGVRTDVASLADVQALADRTWERFGACHVLFNNAGVAVGGPAVEMTHADWEWVMNVNLWGPIHGIEALLPRMVAQGEGGHVLATASFAGLMGNEGLSVYGVTKAGVINLIECLGKELRPHNIGASVLCPMRVETKIYASARNRPAEAGGGEPVPEDAHDRWARRDLAGRVLPIDEVGGMVVRAIRENRLYIHTHPEGRPFVAARFRRIDACFD